MINYLCGYLYDCITSLLSVNGRVNAKYGFLGWNGSQRLAY